MTGLSSKKSLAYLELTAAVIIWGASFVATKIALQEVSPETVVWLRFGIGVLILWLVALLRRQAALPARKDLAYLALLGFIGITFHQWLQSTGLQTAQATTTAWIVATTPIFMALLGWLWLKEKLITWQVFGIILAALGVILVVTEGDFSKLAQGQFGAYGDLLVLISAPNWAIFSALSRRGLKTYSPTRLIFYTMGFGWLFSSLLFLLGPGLAEINNLSLQGWLSILFLGVFCSGLAYTFWYDGLKTLPVAQAGAFLYLEPFVTLIMAALVLNEPLLWASLLGGLLILGGVILVQRCHP